MIQLVRLVQIHLWCLVLLESQVFQILLWGRRDRQGQGILARRVDQKVLVVRIRHGNQVLRLDQILLSGQMDPRGLMDQLIQILHVLLGFQMIQVFQILLLVQILRVGLVVQLGRTHHVDLRVQLVPTVQSDQMARLHLFVQMVQMVQRIL